MRSKLASLALSLVFGSRGQSLSGHASWLERAEAPSRRWCSSPGLSEAGLAGVFWLRSPHGLANLLIVVLIGVVHLLACSLRPGAQAWLRSLAFCGSAMAALVTLEL